MKALRLFGTFGKIVGIWILKMLWTFVVLIGLGIFMLKTLV